MCRYAVPRILVPEVENQVQYTYKKYAEESDYHYDNYRIYVYYLTI